MSLRLSESRYGLFSLCMSYNMVYWHVILPTQGGQYSKANQGMHQHHTRSRYSKQQLTLLILAYFLVSSTLVSQLLVIHPVSFMLYTTISHRGGSGNENCVLLQIASFICRVYEWSACNLDAPKWLPCQPTRWSLAL